MCTILLSINPEYSERILQGVKKYEYRRQIAKKNVDEILIYSTTPEMKVVGSVEVTGVLAKSPETLWNETKSEAGICREKFFQYFNGKEIAYAYQLGAVCQFNPPKTLSDYQIITAPQSFMYL